METVPLKTYCKQTGEKREAVERRMSRGYWVEGVHYYKVAHVRERWIDLKAVAEWVRNGGTTCR